MRFPSVRAAAAEAGRTLRRFPLALLSGVSSAIVGSVMVMTDSHSERITAALAAATLGIPLFVALTVTGERFASRAFRLALSIAGVALLLGLALVWGNWSDPVQWRRYAQFSLAAHLLVAFLPYARGREPNGFWQFNRALFLRFLTSALYSGVLHLGLSLALVAIDGLFKIHVEGKAYVLLWLWLAFVFNSWFFLAGVPADLAALEERRDYPRGLKIFSQFILLPLVVVYLAILSAYLGRVLWSGQWPSGWIGYLVSGVAAIGMLSLLLVHPIRDQEENRWVASYARWFYVAILPAVGMLVAAIGKRVAQYGVTEDRYFVGVLAFWLALIAITFIVRRRADIRWIPATLCALALATAFAPWGAYAVSRRSQTSRLKRVLARAGMLVEGRVQPTNRTLPFETRRDLSSTLAYLMSTHGAGAARPVFGDLSTLSVPGPETVRGDQQAEMLLRQIGVTYVRSWEHSASASFYANFLAGNRAVEVRGVDYHVRLYQEYRLPVEFSIDSVHWELRLDGRARALSLESAGSPSLVFGLDTLIELGRVTRDQSVGTLAPRLTAETEFARAVLTLRSLHGSHQADSISLNSLDGDLYLTLKRRPRVPARPAPGTR